MAEWVPCAFESDFSFVLIPVEGSVISVNRNIGVCAALEMGADYVFMVDSDQQFMPWTLRRLLAGALAGHDIIGAAYPRRGRPPFSLVGKLASGQQLTPDLLHGLAHDVPHEVAELGTGCVLIARKVFEGLGGPHWFKFDVEEQVACPEAAKPVEVLLAQFVSEDYYFMRRARAAGFRVWLDTEVSKCLGHTGRVVHYSQGQVFGPSPNYTSAAWEALAASVA